MTMAVARAGAGVPVWPRRVIVSWRYQEAGGRDARLDLLRGCLVVAMLVDHLGGQSWLFHLTGGNRFFVSAAEGFVFLSGLVMGLVYARLIARDGMGAAVRRALRRAALLYVWAVALGVGFQVVSHWAGASWAEALDDPAGYALGIATLQHSTYLADVLMLYALLVLIAPLALALLARGRSALVVGGSVGLWGLYQVGLTGPIDRAFGGLSWFPPCAWQVVFLGGLVLGYHWRGLRARLAGRRWTWPLAALAAAAAGLIALSIWAPGSRLADSVAAFFGKEELRAGRLLAAAVFFPLLFGLATLVWRPLRAGLGWLLIPLGQQALLAYALHLGLALLAHVWWPRIPGYDLNNPAINTLAQMLMVLLLWALVQALPRLREASAAGLVALAARRRMGWPGRLAGAGLVALLAGGMVVLVQPLAARVPVLAGEPAPAPSVVGYAASVAPAAGERRAAPAGPTPLAKRAVPAAPTPIAARGAAPAARVGEAAGMTPPALPSAAAGEALDQVQPSSWGRTEEHHFFSQALGRDMPYLIYLPGDYDQSGERYPVLYLLHGLGGDRTEWQEYGLVRRADELMAGGSVPPMLIVLPEGEQSYWVNHVEGPRWGDYVALDLVEHIDGQYRTRPTPGQRAIGGLSMGAHAALTLSMAYPERFGVVGVHSPSLRPAEQALPFFGTGAAFDQRDPIALIEAGRLPANLRLWLDVGDQDWWLDAVLRLHHALEQRNIPHHWRLWQGIHDGPYWAEHVADYLRFYGEALKEGR